MVLDSNENLSPEQQELQMLQQYVQETMAQVSGLYARNAALNRQFNELQTKHDQDSSSFRSNLEAKDEELEELRVKGSQLKQELDSLRTTKQALHSELARYKQLIGQTDSTTKPVPDDQIDPTTRPPPAKTARYE